MRSAMSAGTWLLAPLECPRREEFICKNRTARAMQHGPPGGLFGIDQEVVTLQSSGFTRINIGDTTRYFRVIPPPLGR
jgi:hypothetical protein